MYTHKTYSNHQPKVKVGLEVSNFWHAAKKVIKFQLSPFSVKMVQDHFFPLNVQLDCIPSSELSFFGISKHPPVMSLLPFWVKDPLMKWRCKKGIQSNEWTPQTRRHVEQPCWESSFQTIQMHLKEDKKNRCYFFSGLMIGTMLQTTIRKFGWSNMFICLILLYLVWKAFMSFLDFVGVSILNLPKFDGFQ